MSKKYISLYDQILKNSKWNGECLESTYKVKSKRKTPQATYKGKCIGVHRASWIHHNGEIPLGFFICHHCDNPKCFRIEHLFLGTPRDNMQDMIKKGRDNNWGARKYSKEQIENAKNLRNEGYSYKDISEKLNIKLAGLIAFLIRNKVKKGIPKPRPRKYPLDLIDKIVFLQKQGISNKKIFESLGMTESSFYRMTKKVRTAPCN